MKIAVVFSGLPRLLEKSSYYFKKNLLTEGTDLFSFVWKSDEWHLLTDVYSHKVIQFQTPIDFFKKYKETKINIYSHWYGLQYACLNFKTYVQMNNLKYDFIVRTRHDIALFEKINFEHLDKEKIYVADCHWPNSKLFDDNLMIMSQENYFNIFSNIFSWYMSRKDLHSYEDLSEQQLYNYIFNLDLLDKVERNKALDFVLTRGIK